MALALTRSLKRNIRSIPLPTRDRSTLSGDAEEIHRLEREARDTRSRTRDLVARVVEETTERRQ